MSFLKGLLNVAVSLMDTTAKRVDKMDDDEIQKKFPDKSVGEVRNAANAAHMLHERRSNQRET